MVDVIAMIEERNRRFGYLRSFLILLIQARKYGKAKSVHLIKTHFHNRIDITFNSSVVLVVFLLDSYEGVTSTGGGDLLLLLLRARERGLMTISVQTISSKFCN